MDNNDADMNFDPMTAPKGGSYAHTDCVEAASQLYDFLDGELTEDKRQAIKMHLEHCAPCFEAFEFEADLKKLVATRCQEKVPETLKQRIAAVISIEEDSRSLRADDFPDLDVN